MYYIQKQVIIKKHAIKLINKLNGNQNKYKKVNLIGLQIRRNLRNR
jgi:hypothetical protein